MLCVCDPCVCVCVCVCVASSKENEKALEAAEEDKSGPSHADSAELNRSSSFPVSTHLAASYELQTHSESVEHVENVTSETGEHVEVVTSEAVVEIEGAGNEDKDSKVSGCGPM